MLEKVDQKVFSNTEIIIFKLCYAKNFLEKNYNENFANSSTYVSLLILVY